MGNIKCGKGSKAVDIFDSHGTPLVVHFASANESEVKLIASVLDNLPFEDVVPEHLLFDSAADSDPMRRVLQDER